MGALMLATDVCAHFEGFRAYPYPDPASPLARATRGRRWGFMPATEILAGLSPGQRDLPGSPWTIGYGQTGRHVTFATPAWSERVARANLEAEVEERLDMIRQRTEIALTDGQAAALASFLFNVGPGKTGVKDGLFALKSQRRPSSLWLKCQQGRHTEAAAQFGHWVNAGGQPLAGLVTRRAAERRLYLTGAWK